MPRSGAPQSELCADCGEVEDRRSLGQYRSRQPWKPAQARASGGDMPETRRRRRTSRVALDMAASMLYLVPNQDGRPAATVRALHSQLGWSAAWSRAQARPGPPHAPHRSRAAHDPRCPVHVTLRARRALPSLRNDAVFGAIRCAFAAASHDSFRLLQYSVQSDHLHLLVEADGPTRLARGVQGLAIRVARAINRVLRRRGSVWDGRYHAHALRTPREVRNAFVYVLQNFKKHFRNVVGLDPRSSAAWFPGWCTIVAAPLDSAPVVAARTWLARTGWRRHGLLSVGEAPRSP